MTMRDVVALYSEGAVLVSGIQAWLVKDDGRFKWLERLNSNTLTVEPSKLDKIDCPENLNWVGHIDSSGVWKVE